MSDFQPMQPKRTNGLAIAGLITAFVCCFTPVGTILSAIALSQIKKDPTQDGKGLAMAGLIISIIGMVVGIIYYVVIFAWAATDSYYGY
jgi:di/tricarboxylate transporter